MSVKIPVKSNIAVKIRSARNAAYEQFFQVSRILKKDTPYQQIIVLGTYPGGESVELAAYPEYYELDVQCLFLHFNMQLSKEKFKSTNQETLWTIWADDSNDDGDYNDLIVQLDLGNNFVNIEKFIDVEKP